MEAVFSPVTDGFHPLRPGGQGEFIARPAPDIRARRDQLIACRAFVPLGLRFSFAGDLARDERSRRLPASSGTRSFKLSSI